MSGSTDILVRLLLKTQGFDADLGKAKKSVDSFASNIGSKAMAAVGKFAGAVGVAMGGVEAFGRVIQSSQTLGDQWNNTINACKGTVDAFFQSLSTGNWDAFNKGLSGTISNMYRISALKDMLEDAKLTMGFDTKQFEREYVRLEGIIDDETKSKGEREAGYQEMEALVQRFKDRVTKTAEGVAKTLVEEMNAKFGQNFTLQDLETYITEVNNEFLNTETLQRLNKYKEMLAKFDDGGSYSFAEYGGLVMTKEQFMEQNAFLERMRILQDDNDESRKTMLAQLEYANDLYRQADEYLKRRLEKQNKIISLNKTTGTPTTSGSTNKIKAPVYVEYAQYGTDLGQKALKWMNGEEIPVIKTKIEIDEAVDEEDVAKKFTDDVEKKKTKIEEMNAALSSTGQIFGSLGGIMSSFGNDMGAWMLGTVGQIADMIVQLQSLATARAVAEGAKVPFPGNLAAMATVVATIASIFSSLPKFAGGGVVGGSSYFGDKLLARVNSGEAILTQKQQARALSLMSGGDVRVTGDLRLGGKEIYIVLRNYLASSGNKL